MSEQHKHNLFPYRSVPPILITAASQKEVAAGEQPIFNANL